MKARERPAVAEKRRRLENPDVRRWYDNLSRGSVITASNYLRSLFAFCRRARTTPDAFAKLPAGAAYEALLDFVSGEEKRGLAGSAIQTYVKAVKSWLTFRGTRVDRPIKIRGTEQTPTLNDEQVPTPDDLRKILLAASTQQRVAVALVAFSGVRLQVVGDYLGKDGLNLRDLPDLEVEKGTVAFRSLPARVVVRPELSKTGKRYLSWIGSEGASYIVAYLQERVQAGEKLGPETDLYHPAVANKRFVKTKKVSESIRGAIDRAGFDFRPYNLRCYFDTQTLLAESKGKVPHDYRVFWMGHKGSIDARYTTNKGRLPKDLLDDMRGAYARAEEFLSTVPTKTNRVPILEDVLAALLKREGVGDAKIAEVLEGKVSGEELDRILGSRKAQPVERVVPTAGLPPLLAEGWTFVSPVGADQAVVRWPHGDPVRGPLPAEAPGNRDATPV